MKSLAQARCWGPPSVSLWVCLLPLPARADGSLLPQFADFILSVGRYALLPLVFFSTAVALSDLHREKRLWETVGRSLLYMVLGTLLLGPGRRARHPAVQPRTHSHHQPPRDRAHLQELERHHRQSRSQEPVPDPRPAARTSCLPVYVLSFILGLHFPFDRGVTEPAGQPVRLAVAHLLPPEQFRRRGTGLRHDRALGRVARCRCSLIQDIQLYLQVFGVLSLAAVVRHFCGAAGRALVFRRSREPLQMDLWHAGRRGGGFLLR